MRALGQGSPSRKAGAEGISLFLCIGSYLDYTVSGYRHFFFKKKREKCDILRFPFILVFAKKKKIENRKTAHFEDFF